MAELLNHVFGITKYNPLEKAKAAKANESPY